MRFIGHRNKSQGTPTGVINTIRPWFRRILTIQKDNNEGTSIRVGRRRHGHWAQNGTGLGEDRHKGWLHTGLIPPETPTVLSHEDFIPLQDWLLQQLGERQRYILYRINMTSSPQPKTDLERNNWMTVNGPGEIILWEKAIYRVLEKAFQNFKPTHYLFHQHRIEHPLSASRVSRWN